MDDRDKPEMGEVASPSKQVLGGRHQRLNRRWLVLVVVALASIAAVAVFEDNSSHEEHPPVTTQTRTASSTTTSTQPVGTDAIAVKPVIQSLLNRLDQVDSALVADPSAVTGADPLTAQLRSLFESGSPIPTDLSSYRTMAAAGLSWRPAAGKTTTWDTAVLRVEPVSTDEVRADVCQAGHYDQLRGAQVVQRNVSFTPFVVTAVRVDGIWVLRDLDSSKTISEPCAPPALAK